MREWRMKVFSEGFELIESGLKKTIGRAPLDSDTNKRFSEMRQGDLLVFEAVDENKNILDGKNMIFEVSFNHCYKGNSEEAIRGMFKKEGLKNILPDCEFIEEGVRIFMGFPGYPERISKSGIHTIGLGRRIR